MRDSGVKAEDFDKTHALVQQDTELIEPVSNNQGADVIPRAQGFLAEHSLVRRLVLPAVAALVIGGPLVAWQTGLLGFLGGPGPDDFVIKDMKALYQQKGYTELLVNAQRIRPSERGEEWQEMVSAAAVSELDRQLKREKFELAFENSETLQEQFPHLVEVQAYVAKRGEVAAQAMIDCIDRLQPLKTCYYRFLHLFEREKYSSERYLGLGKAVRRRMFHYYATPFFALALKATDDKEGVCSEEDLQMAMEAGLGMSADNFRKPAMEVAFQHCWPTLKSEITKDLDKKGRLFKTNVCEGIKQMDASQLATYQACQNI